MYTKNMVESSRDVNKEVIYLKATGIVRRIDDLGRVVIPKEIRRTLRIREGDPLEIFVDRDGEVILKKYSPIGELGQFAQEYTNALYESVGHACCIADRDNIIAVAGLNKKDYINKPVGPSVEKSMDERKSIMISDPIEHPFCLNSPADDKDEPVPFQMEVFAPIIAAGDAIGAVILLTTNTENKMGEMEMKLAETAASFLAKQMED